MQQVVRRHSPKYASYRGGRPLGLFGRWQWYQKRENRKSLEPLASNTDRIGLSPNQTTTHRSGLIFYPTPHLSDQRNFKHMRAPVPLPRPDPIARARATAPVIAAAADRVEAGCELPPDLLDALHGAGLFRALLPRSLGGDEIRFRIKKGAASNERRV